MIVKKIKNLIKAIWRLSHRSLLELRIYCQFLLSRRGEGPLVLFVVCDDEPGWGSELRSKRVVNYWQNHGKRALFLPSKLLSHQRQRIGRLLKADVVIHQTFVNEKADPRDFPEAINIVDVDDAHFLDARLKQSIIERCLLCDGAVGGSRYTENWLRQHVDKTIMLWTSAPYIHVETASPSSRSKKIIWGTTNPLLTKTEAELVKKIINNCAAKTTFEFIVIGDGSKKEIANFFALGLPKTIKVTHIPRQPYKDFIQILTQGAVGIAPLIVDGDCFNAGKSFGKILAYIAAEVPVVASNAVDHALFFQNGENGFLASEIEEWSDHIVRLLIEPELRDTISASAKKHLQKELSIEAFSTKLYEFVAELYEEKNGVSCCS
ncbi:MAG: hypothetical protein ACJAW1_000053 [Glaciecola sp.]|jgi:hypothetical protein